MLLLIYTIYNTYDSLQNSDPEERETFSSESMVNHCKS